MFEDYTEHGPPPHRQYGQVSYLPIAPVIWHWDLLAVDQRLEYRTGYRILLHRNAAGEPGCGAQMVFDTPRTVTHKEADAGCDTMVCTFCMDAAGIAVPKHWVPRPSVVAVANGAPTTGMVTRTVGA